MQYIVHSTQQVCNANRYLMSSRMRLWIFFFFFIKSQLLPRCILKRTSCKIYRLFDTHFDYATMQMKTPPNKLNRPATVKKKAKTKSSTVQQSCGLSSECAFFFLFFLMNNNKSSAKIVRSSTGVCIYVDSACLMSVATNIIRATS